jgi:hypothetical protein
MICTAQTRKLTTILWCAHHAVEGKKETRTFLASELMERHKTLRLEADDATVSQGFPQYAAYTNGHRKNQ